MTAIQTCSDLLAAVGNAPMCLMPALSTRGGFDNEVLARERDTYVHLFFTLAEQREASEFVMRLINNVRAQCRYIPGAFNAVPLIRPPDVA
ncbi:Hypothetical predicted protein [Podarcis lilfordi]|uniref:Uncharacterized protein n=1 Tax=Podarcis lilfordi TaxID=74358 RepID=A0AA35KD29_9SAUR|nr:Hypothetical predicted protein [Podarcis lilfordi]